MTSVHAIASLRSIPLNRFASLIAAKSDDLPASSLAIRRGAPMWAPATLGGHTGPLLQLRSAGHPYVSFAVACRRIMESPIKIRLSGTAEYGRARLQSCRKSATYKRL